MWSLTSYVMNGPGPIQTFVLVGFALFVISRITAYRRGLQTVSYLPGLRVPFHPMAFPGVLIPFSSPWIVGYSFLWKWRHTLYKKWGNETVSLVPYISGLPTIYSSNLDVARQVSGGGTKNFIKPEASHGALLRWGMNLVASNNETWREHRRIMGPSFNNRLYQMVWSETSKTYHEMISVEGWTDGKEFDVPHAQSLTFKLALLIIGKCGFGFSFNWLEPARSADAKMTIQHALRIISDFATPLLFLPKWIQRLSISGMTEAVGADAHVMEFVKAQVKERKAEVGSRTLSERKAGGTTQTDVFTMLVEANEDEGGKLKLDDDELIGNVYIMLFAGHETTALSLAATIGFLAINNDVQDEIFAHIISVVGYDRAPVYEDYGKLDKVLAAFYEVVRLFPAGHVLIREAAEDTVLEIPKPHGQEGTTTIPVPKGVQVVVDMIGIQYNPRYFDEPEKYKPSRWYGISNEEAFSAFSLGPRACIGRKFATVEAVCFLTLLLRDFEIQPLLRVGETKEEWRDRVLDGRIGITLGVVDVPVRFVRRTRK